MNDLHLLFSHRKSITATLLREPQSLCIVFSPHPVKMFSKQNTLTALSRVNIFLGDSVYCPFTWQTLVIVSAVLLVVSCGMMIKKEMEER